MTDADHNLLARVRERDAAAFEILFERYREPVCRHLARLVRDASAADDLSQDVFLRVWTRADQWNGRGTFRGWLFRIATNLGLNYLRSVERRRERPLEPARDPEEDADGRVPAWLIDAASLGPEAQVALAAEQARLRGLVAELPEEKREVFRMIHEAELDAREVAEALGIPPGTVRSRLHHARQRLAREWLAIEPEQES